MNNLDINNSSRSVFPKKGPVSRQKNAKFKNVALKRNDQDRKNEIESNTKNDAKVSINNVVKDFARIKNAVDAAPEIDNSEKIAALKKQIQNGTYQVDYDALADKILSSEF